MSIEKIVSMIVEIRKTLKGLSNMVDKLEREMLSTMNGGHGE